METKEEYRLRVGLPVHYTNGLKDEAAPKRNRKKDFKKVKAHRRLAASVPLSFRFE